VQKIGFRKLVKGHSYLDAVCFEQVHFVFDDLKRNIQLEKVARKRKKKDTYIFELGLDTEGATAVHPKTRETLVLLGGEGDGIPPPDKHGCVVRSMVCRRAERLVDADLDNVLGVNDSKDTDLRVVKAITVVAARAAGGVASISANRLDHPPTQRHGDAHDAGMYVQLGGSRHIGLVDARNTVHFFF